MLTASRITCILFFVNLINLSAQNSQIQDTIVPGLMEIYGLRIKFEKLLLIERTKCSGIILIIKVLYIRLVLSKFTFKEIR